MMPGGADALVCIMADPVKPPAEFAETMLPAIALGARMHGVGPVVLRKLAGRCDPAALIELRSEVEAHTAMTLRLRGIATDMQAFIDKEGIGAAIVKGPVFSRQLYAFPGDRPFTDIDILGTSDARAALAGYLGARGFHLYKKAVFDRTEANQEEKWVHAGDPSLLIELHGNLVHYAGLRRKAGFGHGELMQIAPGDPQAPLSLFFVAVVHAALGHKFHQLRFLVDVLQAYRGLEMCDREAVAATAERLCLRMETAQCLRLIAGLFGEQDAMDMARLVAPGLLAKVAGGLVTPQTVMDAPFTRGSRLRRHAFRRLQYLAVR
ncbi:MAG: nucleotidyltransferase family protein [Notoacmeibacter sp.]|nr:nucleotidyltransferase family protein [Notoacmeibacter sp.]